MDFLKHLLDTHFVAVLIAAGVLVALVVALIAWLLKTAKKDRKSAKRELYVLATLKRILFSKDSAESIMEDLEKPNTPLDETMSQPQLPVPDLRKSKP